MCVQLATSVQEIWRAISGQLTNASGGEVSLGATDAADDGWSNNRLARLEHLLALLEHACALISSIPSSPTTPSAMIDAQSVVQTTPGKVTAVRKLLSNAAALVGGGARGRFVWVDGPLVTAVQQGNWLLLDNPSLCNPSVLDRLNPLLERGGVLQLPECGLQADGSVRELRAHAAFRLLLCIDPSHGELSRAMRTASITPPQRSCSTAFCSWKK